MPHGDSVGERARPGQKYPAEQSPAQVVLISAAAFPYLPMGQSMQAPFAE